MLPEGGEGEVMSEGKFTPGPWAAETVRGFMVEEGSCVHLIGTEDAHLCAVFSWINNPEDAKEALANAHLIAAAPDLLEALEALEALVRHAEQLGRRSAVYESARAAIAKARGE